MVQNFDADEAITGAASCRYTASLEHIELTTAGLAGAAKGFGNAKAVRGRSATKSVDTYGDMVGDASKANLMKGRLKEYFDINPAASLCRNNGYIGKHGTVRSGGT